MSIILKGIDPKTDYGLCILTIKGELITANGKHIQAISTIDEPKVGRWIIREEPKEGLPRRWRVECPKCHKRLRIADRKLWDYCPRCGAKMEGE